MAVKRQKRQVIQPITVTEAENVMSNYANYDAQIEEIEAKMDQEITLVRDKYADKLQLLGDKRGEEMNKLQLFAESNTELFDKKKSLPMAHGRIGFRTGTPKLKTLKGFTWAAVTNLLRVNLPAYVKVQEAPMKDKLLADRDNPEVNQYFTKEGVGIEVVQDETFFIELKKEEFANAN